MAKAGRPSDYSDKLVETICDRIADGESLRTICAEPSMPNRMTVLRWLDKYPECAAKYARAREFQGDVMDDLIMDVATTVTPENAAAARVTLDALKWRAAKLRPKVYGDKVQQQVTGADGGPVTFVLGVPRLPGDPVNE